MKNKLKKILEKKTSIDTKIKEVLGLLNEEMRALKNELDNQKYIVKEKDVITTRALAQLGLIRNSVRGLNSGMMELTKSLNDTSGVDTIMGKVNSTEASMLTVTYKDSTTASYPCILERRKHLEYMIGSPEEAKRKKVRSAVLLTHNGEKRAVCIECLETLALFSEPDVLCPSCKEALYEKD